eukprot:scaffold194478_cov17-Tisochrysis_lutea.AAC.1
MHRRTITNATHADANAQTCYTASRSIDHIHRLHKQARVKDHFHRLHKQARVMNVSTGCASKLEHAVNLTGWRAIKLILQRNMYDVY